jgi:hypothetical protein
MRRSRAQAHHFLHNLLCTAANVTVQYLKTPVFFQGAVFLLHRYPFDFLTNSVRQITGNGSFIFRHKI